MKNKYDEIDNKLNNLLTHLSHAYLFVINDNLDSKTIIDKFIKSILIKDEDKETAKLIIKAVDNNTFSEIKEIKPDGMWIKKEQMTSLKDEFKTKVLNSKKRIYIINEADKLNPSSSNSILKFLEEPEEDIIAILTTNNLGGVLNTVVSRCQVINLPKTDTEDLNLEEKLYFLFKNTVTKEDYIKNDYGKEFITNTINFVSNLEEQKAKMICFSKEYFHNIFKKREDIEIVFQIMLLMYKDTFSYKNTKSTQYFRSFEEELSKIDKNNSNNSLINKINILIQKKDLIKNNISVNLLIDSLIFEFEGASIW